MSTLDAGYFEPVAWNKHLDRLLVYDDGDGLSGRDWEQIHEEIQRELAPLDDALRRHVPDLCVDSGKTKGEQFVLFSYRRFSRAGGGTIDPVVAGLTFITTNDQIAIDADLSGEQTGDLIVSLPQQLVPAVRDQLVTAARQVARQLSQPSEQIANALMDASRQT